MKKISKVLYDRLYVQAELAKDIGNKQLSDSIFKIIGAGVEEFDQNINEIEDNVKSSLINCIIDLADHYNKQDIDISEINKFSELFVKLFIKKSKEHLKVD